MPIHVQCAVAILANSGICFAAFIAACLLPSVSTRGLAQLANALALYGLLFAAVLSVIGTLAALPVNLPV